MGCDADVHRRIWEIYKITGQLCSLNVKEEILSKNNLLKVQAEQLDDLLEGHFPTSNDHKIGRFDRLMHVMSPVTPKNQTETLHHVHCQAKAGRRGILPIQCSGLLLIKINTSICRPFQDQSEDFSRCITATGTWRKAHCKLAYIRSQASPGVENSGRGVL